VSANLALTLARLGHRVLIIDANMRHPVQHSVWDVPNVQGFTNVVAGQASLQQAITQHEPNLHILPVGTIPPNPLAIFESDQTSSLLQACKEVYDYIIIDTPAVFRLADTLTLGRVTDGMLVVMQPGIVDFVSLSETKSLLAQSHQRVLGLIANGITDNTKSDQYFTYNQEYTTSQKVRDDAVAIPNPVNNAVNVKNHS
jgi:capsular exopolysaccharide synthesis family protein